MASVALVDSSVFISLLRTGRDPAQWLGERLEDIYTCGMIRVEVLRGQKFPKHRKALSAFFDVLCNVPTDNTLWEEAAQLAWRLDRRGKNLPAQDIIIAAHAFRSGVPVMTSDRRFKEIPGLPVIWFS